MGKIKKVAKHAFYDLISNVIIYFTYEILFLEEVLNSLIGNHLLIENVCTGLRALHHLNHLCISATIL